MNTFKNKASLNPLLSKELHDLGQCLRLLRLKRNITIVGMCERIGAKNPRTVSKIEKGDATVSLGTFIEYINVLGLRKLFKRMVFNILVFNNDDHMRNHGFIYAGN